MPTEAEKVRIFNRQLADAYQQGNYEEAYQYALLAIVSARAAYGEASAVYGIITNNTAMLLRRLGRLLDAEPFSRLALKVSEGAVGKKHIDYATNLNNLGLLLTDLGKYEEAERLLMEAVDLRKEILGEESTEYATSLNNLALLYRETWRYEQAITSLISSGAIRRRLLGENCLEYAESVNNLGAMYQTLGRFQEAATFLYQAVQIYERLLGTNHPDHINAVSNLGMLLKEIGKHRGAEEHLQFALTIRAAELGKDHPDYAISLGNLAGLYLELGRFEQAITIYWEAVEITGRLLGEQHPMYAAVLDNLALAYCEMGEYNRAEPLYRQALILQEQALGENHPDYALSLNNLGFLLYHTHRYQEAIVLLGKAHAIQCKRLNPGHPDRTYTENNLASAYLAIAEYDKAEKLYRNRLRTSRKIFGVTHADYARALNNLAFLDAARGRYKEALTRLKHVVEIENSQMATIFAISSETQRLQFKIKLYTTYHAMLSLVIHHLSHRSGAVQCAADLILQRKALTAEPSLALRYAVLSDRYPNLREDFHRLLTLKQQIPQAINTLGKYDLAVSEGLRWAQNLTLWQREHEETEQRLARQVPEVGLQASLAGARWESVSAHLPQNACLIEFVRYFPYDFYAVEGDAQKSRWGKARFAAFVFTPSSTAKVSVVDLGDAEIIEALTTAYVQCLSDAATAERVFFGRDTAYAWNVLEESKERLTSAIWHPLLALLGGSERAVICPDGVLHLLPFETLLSLEGRPGGLKISYLNTGRELLQISTVPENIC
jgi:tetratricopeptide (TPR) repeat protein